MSVVVLAGGVPHAHDFDAHRAALAAIVRSAGDEAIEADHPDAAADVLGPDVTALVVSGLWWRMEGAAYDRWRDDYRYSPPESTRAALTDFVDGGGGLLAMHTAAICFDDWPEWGDVVGGRWMWGVSSHPPHGPVSAQLDPDHPLTAGLPPTLDLDDEVYGDLELGDDLAVCATARRSAGDEPQPVLWTHTYGRGRVVYDGFGHDERSLTAPDHVAIIERAMHWVGADR